MRFLIAALKEYADLSYGPIRIEETKQRISIREFEEILADLLDSVEALSQQFKSAERAFKQK